MAQNLLELVNNQHFFVYTWLKHLINNQNSQLLFWWQFVKLWDIIVNSPRYLCILLSNNECISKIKLKCLVCH